jgi:hypothetical protein
VAQLPVTDAGVTLAAPGFVQLASAAHKAQFYVSTQPFPARRAFDGAVFGGKLYVIGGRSGGLGPVTEFGDVWSSVDGVNWRQENPAAIPARTGHRVAVHNGRIYVAGGQSGNTLMGDVWSSADGVNWQQETAGRQLHCARRDHELVSFANRLWVLSAGDDGTQRNDVWSSADGVDWLPEEGRRKLSGADTRIRYRNLNGTLYLVGGFSAGFRT